MLPSPVLVSLQCNERLEVVLLKDKSTATVSADAAIACQSLVDSDLICVVRCSYLPNYRIRQNSIACLIEI